MPILDVHRRWSLHTGADPRRLGIHRAIHSHFPSAVGVDAEEALLGPLSSVGVDRDLLPRIPRGDHSFPALCQQVSIRSTIVRTSTLLVRRDLRGDLGHGGEQHAPDAGHRGCQRGSSGPRSPSEASYASTDRLAQASKDDDPALVRLGPVLRSVHAADARRAPAGMLHGNGFRRRLSTARHPLLVLRHLPVSIS